MSIRRILLRQSLSTAISPVIGLLTTYFSLRILQPESLALYLSVLAVGGVVSAILNMQISNLVIYLLYNSECAKADIFGLVRVELILGTLISMVSIFCVQIFLRNIDLWISIFMFIYWAGSSTLWSLNHILTAEGRETYVINLNTLSPILKLLIILIIFWLGEDLLIYYLLGYLGPDILKFFLMYDRCKSFYEYKPIRSSVVLAMVNKSLLYDSYFKGLVRDFQLNMEMILFNRFPNQFFISTEALAIGKRLEASLKGPLESFNVVVSKIISVANRRKYFYRIHLGISIFASFFVYLLWPHLEIILRHANLDSYVRLFPEVTRYRLLICISIVFIPKERN